MGFLFIGSIVFIAVYFNKNENFSKAVNKKVSVLDCGVSKNKFGTLFKTTYEEDSTLVCLGNAILNNCKHSKAILDAGNLGQVNVEVKKNSQECVGIMRYEKAGQISRRDLKGFAIKDIECPLDFELLKKQDYGPGSTGENFTETPGRLANTAYEYIMFQAFMLYPKTECIVSVFDS